MKVIQLRLKARTQTLRQRPECLRPSPKILTAADECVYPEKEI